MPSSASITGVIKELGRIYINFSDGSQMEFNSIVDIKQSIKEIDTDPNMVKFFFLAWWVSRDSNMSNENLVKNKTMTFDLSSANPIKVQ